MLGAAGSPAGSPSRRAFRVGTRLIEGAGAHTVANLATLEMMLRNVQRALTRVARAEGGQLVRGLRSPNSAPHGMLPCGR